MEWEKWEETAAVLYVSSGTKPCSWKLEEVKTMALFQGDSEGEKRYKFEYGRHQFFEFRNPTSLEILTC